MKGPRSHHIRVPRKRIEANKWLVAGTVMFGAFMAVMDISVVNVALPHMMGSFSEDLSIHHLGGHRLQHRGNYHGDHGRVAEHPHGP